MNAQELYLKNGNATGVYFCEKCRNVARSKELAEVCCKQYLCSVCGKPVDRQYWSKCDACIREEERAKEAERFEKATKVLDTVYRDWVTDGDEGFWPDSGEYLDSLDGEEPAKYLWSCLPRQFVKVDTDSIIEHIVESGYADFDSEDLDGWKEFESAIKTFENANKSKVCYEADYTRAVIITKDKEA